MTYHRMYYRVGTHIRTIWYRTSDLAIVYEEMWDGGTSASYTKLFEGGIIENWTVNACFYAT